MSSGAATAAPTRAPTRAGPPDSRGYDELFAGARLPLAVALLASIVGLLAWRSGVQPTGAPPLSGGISPISTTAVAALWRARPTAEAFWIFVGVVDLLLLAAAAGIFAAYVRERLGLGTGAAVIATLAGWLYLPLWHSGSVPLSGSMFVLLIVLVLAHLARMEGGFAAAETIPELSGIDPLDRDGVVSPRRWGPLVVLLLLLVHTHPAGVAFVVAAVVGLALRRGLAPAAVTAGAVGLGMLPWVLWGRRSAAAATAIGVGEWPSKAADLAVTLARALLPGLPEPLLPLLGPLLVAGVGAGAVLLARRSPGAAAGLGAYLVLILAWPFRDPPLVAPAVPLAGLCLVLTGRALLRPASESRKVIRVVRVIVGLWIVGYAVGAGVRLLEAAGTRERAIAAHHSMEPCLLVSTSSASPWPSSTASTCL